jgi:GAF domain-containing protein
MTSPTASSRKAQAILRAREDSLETRAKGDLLAVMSTAPGRRFVWGLIEGVFAPSYASEALATAYNEGRRSVAIGLMVRCQQDATNQYVQALTEQLADQAADATTRAAAEAAPAEEES